MTPKQDTISGAMPWQLPLSYKEMPPHEQATVIRSSILRFLDDVRRATKDEIRIAINAPNQETVRKHLQYLASTQQVYVDFVGRDPLYFRNGTLAHHLLQSNIRVGMTEYVIRTYNDPLTGRYVTITEYAVSPLGEPKAKSGIRVDFADLDSLIQELSRIRRAAEEDQSLFENKLKR